MLHVKNEVTHTPHAAVVRFPTGLRERIRDLQATCQMRERNLEKRHADMDQMSGEMERESCGRAEQGAVGGGARSVAGRGAAPVQAVDTLTSRGKERELIWSSTRSGKCCAHVGRGHAARQLEHEREKASVRCASLEAELKAAKARIHDLQEEKRLESGSVRPTRKWRAKSRRGSKKNKGSRAVAEDEGRP